MNDTNKTLGKSGAGQIVNALGRDWTVYPPDDKDYAAFQAYLESKARRDLVAAKADMETSEYVEWRSAVIDKTTTGHYAWGRAAAQEAFSGPAGFLRFFRILLNRHPEQKHVDDDYARQLFDAADEEWCVVLCVFGLVSFDKSAQRYGDEFSKKVATRKESPP